MSDAFTMPVERWSGSVLEVEIGATPDRGGTRARTVKVGGAKTLPFLRYEGDPGNPSVLAFEVLDRPRESWAPALEEVYGDVKTDPAAWAQRCEREFGAEMICLRFEGANPDDLDRSPADCAALAKAVAASVTVPLVLWGCGNADKDNNLWPELSQALAGERCILASATQDNYRTIAACALADKHIVLTEAPLDINIQKQVNILVTEMGIKAQDMVMYQTTGALGYGIEYAYSIYERSRLAALDGDAMLRFPMVSMVGAEAWKAKEASASAEDVPEWGDLTRRGVLWEAATASLLLQGGTDIVIMWHPEAARLVRATLAELTAAAGA